MRRVPFLRPGMPSAICGPEPVRACIFLDALRRLPLTSVEALTKGLPFVVLSPHPDDESLGAGGLLAAARAVRQRAEVVILTDGAGSHPNSREFPRDRLVVLRKREAEQAAINLGLADGHLSFLDLPDTQAPLEGPAFERAVARIAGIVEEARAKSLFVSWEHDPHCDHEAAARMARAVQRRNPAVKLWFYPIWGWHLDPETRLEATVPRGYRIDITPWLEAKHAAIRAHASQMTGLIVDDPCGFRFDAETIAPFMGPFEYFFEASP
jgi:LmbE family N-acetylglucosaminyl deacetylase